MKNILARIVLISTLILSFATASAESRPPVSPKLFTDANVSGHITSAESGEHIPYISITVKGTNIGVVADGTGHYMMVNLPTGEHTLIASAVGYKSAEQEISVSAKKSYTINFSLEEQALNMDQVIVSASRRETNRRSSATVVNLATTELFSNTAASAISESMSYQPGLRVENTCNNCGAAQLRINGLEGHYSQVLLDSRPIFSSLAMVYGIEQIPVSMVERVEVVRGGGSALFGSNAIGGVVNIITKEPTRNTLSLSNTTNILEGGTTDFTNSINGSYVSSDYRTGAYIYGMTRDREGYDRNGDGFTDLVDIESQTVGFRGYHKINPYAKITAEYHHIGELRRGGDNISEPPHAAQIAEQLKHNINGGGLTFDYLSPNYKHKLSVYTSMQGIERQSYFGTNMDLNAYGSTDDFTFIAGTQYDYSFDKFLFAPSDLVFGVEYTSNKLHDVMLGYDRDLTQQTNVVGSFLQNEWHTDKFNFALGARLDKHNMLDTPVFSPRANIRYTPIKGIGLRASYSSGYRAPQAYNEDLHIEAVAGSVSLIEIDPNLRPEYSNSFSGSVDLYRTFGDLQTNLLIEGFYTKLDDVFTLEQIGNDAAGNIILQRRNAAGAVVKGITTELMVGMNNIFDVQAGYTFQRSLYNEPEAWSDSVEAQRRMFRSPDHYGYFTANGYITDNFKTSLFANYTGSMLVQHAEGYAAADADVVTPDFWDISAQLSYKFEVTNSFNIELSTGVKNILDSYQSDLDRGASKDAGYIYGPSLPRTYFVGVKMGF